MRSLNLMPAYRIAANQRRAYIRRWICGCAIYAASLGGAVVAAHVFWPDGRNAVASDLSTLDAQARADELEVKRLMPQLALAQTTLAAAQSIGDQPNWSSLTGLCANLLGDDAVLRQCRLEPAKPEASATGEVLASVVRYRVFLEGYGRSQAAVLRYVYQLEQTGLFDRVTLIETRGEAFYDAHAIAFQIDCVLADRAGGVK